MIGHKMIKKIIFLLVLFIGTNLMANDLSVLYTDSIADTAITTVRADTVYSDPVMDIRWKNQFNFYKSIIPYNGMDTNWVNDTFFVKFHHSFDRVNWFTCEIDTLLDTTIGSIDEFVLKTSDSVIGNWGRLMMIHWDSLETTQPALLSNTYKYRIMLWIAPKD